MIFLRIIVSVKITFWHFINEHVADLKNTNNTETFLVR